MTSHCISIDPVEINAPAQIAWDVLSDLAKYPEWNPFTVKVISTLQIGEPVTIYIARDNGKQMKQQLRLEALEPPHKIVWSLPKLGHRRLFNAWREQHIVPLSDHRCTYSTSDTFNGWIAGIIYRTQQQWVSDNFRKLAAALKARAEAISV